MTRDDALEYFGGQAQRLADLLRDHGAEGADFRVDLREGKFWWQDASGKPLVQARTRVICSYALSNESVLMAWANESLPAAARIDAVEGMEPAYEEQSGSDAWGLAAEAAAAGGADFIYRAPNPQMWIFLALWDVGAAHDDSATAPRPPRKHVIELLDHLGAMEPSEARATLMRNYGKALCESAEDFHVGQPWAALVGEIGRLLVENASAADADADDMLAELRVRADAGLEAE